MQNLIIIMLVLGVSLPAHAADAPHAASAIADTRVVVDFPEDIKQAMLERMRKNLADLYEIQMALSKADFKRASDIAEYKLGVSSVGPHNARQAPYMPHGMHQVGTEIRSASSRFALVAQEEDMPKALDALSKVTGLCVACHAGYRVK